MKDGKRVQTARPNRANGETRTQEVRSADLEGGQLGIVSLREAPEKAEGIGVDLVEISPNAESLVCRIMDYDESLYERDKSPRKQKKEQRVIQAKEVKFRLGTDKDGYQVKPRGLIHFLEKGDKVKVTLCFRGREAARQQIGMKVLSHVKGDLQELAVVESFSAKIEGRQMIMIPAPGKEQ